MRLLILSLFLFTSCSTTIVYAPKTVSVCGNSDNIEIKGSDLKDNQATQSSDPIIDIPLIK